MNLKRKDFIKLGALAVTSGALPGFSSCSASKVSTSNKSNLSSIAADQNPISVFERETRIDKAQQLHVKNNKTA